MIRKAQTSRETMNRRNSNKLLAASANTNGAADVSPTLDLSDITQKVLSSEIKLNGQTYTAYYLPFNAETALTFYDHKVIADDDLLYRFVWITTQGWCDEFGNLKYAPLGFDEFGNPKPSPTASREDYEQRKGDLTKKTNFQFWNLLAGLILSASGFGVKINVQGADADSTESPDADGTESNPTKAVQSQSPNTSTPPKSTGATGGDSAT